jgi:hypothetical protein
MLRELRENFPVVTFRPAITFRFISGQNMDWLIFSFDNGHEISF